MRLHVKVLIFLLLTALIFGSGVILFSKKAVYDILIGEAGKRGLLKTRDLPTATASGFRSASEPMLLPALQKSLEETGALYAMALDQKGRVLAHTNVVEKGKIYRDRATTDALQSNVPRYLPREVEGQPILDVSLPVWSVRQADSSEEFLFFGGKELNEKERLGTLRVGLPIGEALQTVDRITRQIVGITIVIGAMAIGSALIFVRGMLRRIHALAEGTEKVSRGEYVEVAVREKDELGDLAKSFNRMSIELSSARANLENQVKERTQELEAFVYTVSHDLKAPLVSMLGMASVLQQRESDKLDEKGKHHLDRIVANASFMERLITDLLTLARVGKQHENPEPVDVRLILKQVVQMQGEIFAQKNIQVIIQPSFPSFTFDRAQLSQVFQNLLTNAAKFMGDQPQPKIEIGGSESAEFVEFFVRDNGIGIDPAYHEKVFGVFQRLQDLKVEGTGVGLSIVKKIADQAGGKVWVQSQKGCGATFFVRLPRKTLGSP